MIKSINLAWIVVTDIKKAIKYYTEVVGLKLNQFDENYGWAELSGHEGGTVLGIAEKSDMEQIQPGQNAVVTFTVEDLNQTCIELTKKKVAFLGEVLEIPGHVKMQLCVDQDGNHFQLVEVLGEK